MFSSTKAKGSCVTIISIKNVIRSFRPRKCQNNVNNLLGTGIEPRTAADFTTKLRQAQSDHISKHLQLGVTTTLSETRMTEAKTTTTTQHHNNREEMWA